jgi:predicted RNase H-like nuclease (RuvC/YqgF family)
MWQKVLDFARLLWNQGEETKKNSAAIKELQQEHAHMSRQIHVLAAHNQQLLQELEHYKQIVAKDLENLELRMKMDRLESGRALPPKE